MLKNIKLLGLTICLVMATSVQAEDVYSSGRGGEAQRRDDRAGHRDLDSQGRGLM